MDGVFQTEGHIWAIILTEPLISGVTRKAIVKGVAKGALQYKLKDGRRVNGS